MTHHDEALDGNGAPSGAGQPAAGVQGTMAPSPAAYDIAAPLTATERLRFLAWVTYAKWKWRSLNAEDRHFLKRLEARGLSIDVIWDIGASNGAWSLLVSCAFENAEVLLFEPLAQFDESYCFALRNHLDRHPNWKLRPHALGGKASIATLYKDAASYGSSLISSDYAKANWKPINVAVHTIEELIDTDGLRPPDVIKIDTQGFEAEILSGAGRHLSSAKVLLLESWLSRAYGPETPLFDELVALLEPHGFVLAEVHSGYCDGDGMMHSIDAFFLRQDIAQSYGIQRAPRPDNSSTKGSRL